MHTEAPVGSRTYGILAQFDSVDALMKAAEKVAAQGFKNTDAFSPFPIEGLTEALGHKDTKLPYFVFCCGLTGFLIAIGLQGWTSVIDYPINVGGRPLWSWPAFIPITFELTVLLSAFGCVFGMLGRNGFPQPYHPLFNVEAFKAATRDGFFLCIEAADPLFKKDKVNELFKSLGARGVYEVQD